MTQGERMTEKVIIMTEARKSENMTSKSMRLACMAFQETSR